MNTFLEGSHIHLVGIAGSGMNGIARILLRRGFTVSGSDEKESATLNSLAKLGAKTFVGHRAEQVAGANYVVISSAITESNPEVVAAKEAGIEVIRRASALARLLPGKFSVAVAGTHGKTTTSGMLAQLLQDLGRSPSFVIGSNISALGESAKEGDGDEFVIEADESDGSFLEYQPDAAIITNIELDHVDNFESIQELVHLFERFAATAKEMVILCHDDPHASSLKIPVNIRRISYGMKEGADLRIAEVVAEDGGTRSRLIYEGEEIGSLKVAVPGLHNALNAAGVVATALGMGLNGAEVIAALSSFRGTSRRFDIKGIVNGITIVDDYGHHPTEIRATILAARAHLAAHHGGRLAVIFQPHRFSRTQVFVEEFAAALSGADRCIVMDIYGAGESAIEGVTSASITDRSENALHLSDRNLIIDEMKLWARPGDLIMTLGAGDVTDLAPQLLSALELRK